MLNDYSQISSIPHLYLLMSRINIVADHENKSSQATEIAIERLAYSLSESARALLSLGNSLTETINARKARTIPTAQQISTYQMSVQERERISFTIDAYLHAARNAQNSISPYISKILRISLPQSLPDIVKNITDGKTILPQRIAELITSVLDLFR